MPSFVSGPTHCKKKTFLKFFLLHKRVVGGLDASNEFWKLHMSLQSFVSGCMF